MKDELPKSMLVPPSAPSRHSRHNRLPSLDGREATHAFTDTADTVLGKVARAPDDAALGTSGVHAINDPHEAFAARALLAGAAERSLDLQYYSWGDDTTGWLLLEALWRAAERGVRVRLLLDDGATKGMDATLAALDCHRNIDVRLFNPFPDRRFRVLGYLTDFFRLNRRMHNKSFTADSQATIVGGRNVGNKYFGATDGMAFADLDIIAVGTVVDAVSRTFDGYWNSASAYPVQLLAAPPTEESRDTLQRRLREICDAPEAEEYLKVVESTEMMDKLLAGALDLEWVSVKLFYDEPGKVLERVDRSALMVNRVEALFRDADEEVDVVSPYFVTGKRAAKWLADFPGHGTRVRVLTNSLAATDVAAVHAGYARRRKTLLQGGVKLYELKAEGGHDHSKNALIKAARRGGSSRSASALHAKIYAFDRQRVFVGSFNMDQRSVRLNTEMGLLIESPGLASMIGDYLDDEVRAIAYEPKMTSDGRSIEWIEYDDDKGEQHHRTEPKTSLPLRIAVHLMAKLPIEWML